MVAANAVNPWEYLREDGLELFGADDACWHSANIGDSERMAKDLPKEVLEQLAKLEPQVREAFLEAIDNITNDAQISRVEALISEGRIDEAIAALGITADRFAQLHEAERAGMVMAGQATINGLKIKDPYSGVTTTLGFDGSATRAEQWAKTASSTLITAIVDDQREMSRTVIQAGIEAGKGPRTTALDIVGRVNRVTGKREGGFIGLTNQQAQWALNAEDELRTLDKGYFNRKQRDKRFDRLVAKAIREGKPLAEADIRRITTRYRDKLLKYRGDVIARTESLDALRAGQAEGFRQLVASGKVRDDQIVKTWSATMDNRTRHDHRAMNRQAVRGVDTVFTFPDGTQARYPGDTDLGASAKETIQCRCWCMWRVKSDLMRDD